MSTDNMNESMYLSTGYPIDSATITEMFNSIIKIATLAISNTQRYEELVVSKNDYEYSSNHDGFTGVFNRTYYNKIVQEVSTLCKTAEVLKKAFRTLQQKIIRTILRS